MNYLREKVKEKIKLYENVNSIEALDNYKKFKIIEELLKDDACFFKINSSIAYTILVELEVNNPLNYYKKLISYNEYKKNKDNFDL